MDRQRTKEEYLEVLWYMRENREASLAYFRAELDEQFRQDIVDELIKEGVVEIQGDAISLTERGRVDTRQLIRSHRLAERLVYNVLGVEYETGACEFEHIINADLVDSICTLLGHPRECPHGMPIPEGECCVQQAQMVESAVVPLQQLEVGETARIAYVYAANDQQLHKLDNLLIRPGTEVKLHQRYPSFVVECEKAREALDEVVASQIHVWLGSRKLRTISPHGRRKGKRGFRHGQR